MLRIKCFPSFGQASLRCNGALPRQHFRPISTLSLRKDKDILKIDRACRTTGVTSVTRFGDL